MEASVRNSVSASVTLNDLLPPHFLLVSSLQNKHRTLLLAVSKFIGAASSCDELLERWPPAFTANGRNLQLPTANANGAAHSRARKQLSMIQAYRQVHYAHHPDDKLLLRMAVLAQLRSSRARRAIAAQLEMQLADSSSGRELPPSVLRTGSSYSSSADSSSCSSAFQAKPSMPVALKQLAALVFAAAARIAPLQDDIAGLAVQQCGVTEGEVLALIRFARTEIPDAVRACKFGNARSPPQVDVYGVDPSVSHLVLVLAHVCAKDPSQLCSHMLELLGKRLSPEHAVEIFAWLSVLGALQQLYSVYLPEVFREAEAL
jgi:hypothetical protein